ncbi:MAG: DoxX family protein [Candidatus Caenarcaniphilales bacterium]|nr:DoxX family protein [Candidatus Caenarcaniphilales bacterium]
MILNFSDKYTNFGLLFLRVAFGIMFLFHGYPKIVGGVDEWIKLGQVMEMIGITFAPEFWGFMAAFAEFFGGILLILGFFFRPACLLLFCTMAMATTMHILKGDEFNIFSHALEDAIVFFSLFFVGPGSFSIDKKLVNN